MAGMCLTGDVAAQAFMWELTFMAAPTALPHLEHGLKVDERVLRYIVMKKQILQPFPNPYRVSRLARRLLQQPPV